MRRHPITFLLLMVATSSGCSVFFQDSVRSDGVYCSTSRFWVASDVALAGVAVYGASESGEKGMLIPAGTFAASAAYGLFKRSRCISYRSNASYETWQRDTAEQERRDEAQMNAMRAFRQQVVQPQPVRSWSRAPVRSGSSTLTINGRTYVDGPDGALGRPCSIENNTCPSSYACQIVVGNSGSCVPKSQ